MVLCKYNHKNQFYWLVRRRKLQQRAHALLAALPEPRHIELLSLIELRRRLAAYPTFAKRMVLSPLLDC